MKIAKVYTVIMERHRTGRESQATGTLEELNEIHSYTLRSGESRQHEKGNKKINCNPKSISVLIKNLNNASNNSAANGYSGVSYRTKEM